MFILSYEVRRYKLRFLPFDFTQGNPEVVERVNGITAMAPRYVKVPNSAVAMARIPLLLMA